MHFGFFFLFASVYWTLHNLFVSDTSVFFLEPQISRVKFSLSHVLPGTRVFKKTSTHFETQETISLVSGFNQEIQVMPS